MLTITLESVDTGFNSRRDQGLVLACGGTSRRHGELAHVDQIAVDVAEILAAHGHPVSFTGFEAANLEDADEARLQAAAKKNAEAPGTSKRRQPVAFAYLETHHECECCGSYSDRHVVISALHPSDVTELYEDGHMSHGGTLQRLAAQLWSAFAALDLDAQLDRKTVPETTYASLFDDDADAGEPT